MKMCMVFLRTWLPKYDVYCYVDIPSLSIEKGQKWWKPWSPSTLGLAQLLQKKKTHPDCLFLSKRGLASQPDE